MRLTKKTSIYAACLVMLGTFSIQARAVDEKMFESTIQKSLSEGMTTKAARSYVLPNAEAIKIHEVNKESSPSAKEAVDKNSFLANSSSAKPGEQQAGTNAAGGGSNSANAAGGGSGGGSNGGFGGNTTMPGASTNQYAYTADGQLVNVGNSGGAGYNNNDFMGPVQSFPGTVVGNGGFATNGQEVPDWIRMVQVAAPIVAGVTGNDKIAGAASILGSGANLYQSTLTNPGGEFTLQNYANMGNIALQGAALATNNANIDKAAQLSNIGTGAWNTYGAMQPQGGAATGPMQLVGYNNNGQPVYQQGPAQSQPGWSQVATTFAPQVGSLVGNQKVGQLVGLAGNVGSLSGIGNSQPGYIGTPGIVPQVSTAYPKPYSGEPQVSTVYPTPYSGEPQVSTVYPKPDSSVNYNSEPMPAGSNRQYNAEGILEIDGVSDYQRGKDIKDFQNNSGLYSPLPN